MNWFWHHKNSSIFVLIYLRIPGISGYFENADEKDIVSRSKRMDNMTLKKRLCCIWKDIQSNLSDSLFDHIRCSIWHSYRLINSGIICPSSDVFVLLPPKPCMYWRSEVYKVSLFSSTISYLSRFLLRFCFCRVRSTLSLSSFPCNCSKIKHEKGTASLEILNAAKEWSSWKERNIIPFAVNNS